MTYYLDARPMVRALYEAPEEFEIRRNCLRHRPSKHWLIFDDDGSARILARCDCVVLPVSQEQGKELYEAAATWEASYWQPLARAGCGGAPRCRDKPRICQTFRAALAVEGSGRRSSVARGIGPTPST